MARLNAADLDSCETYRKGLKREVSNSEPWTLCLQVCFFFRRGMSAGTVWLWVHIVRYLIISYTPTSSRMADTATGSQQDKSVQVKLVLLGVLTSITLLQ